MPSIRSALMGLTIFLSPLIGVGVAVLVTGRALGTGLQPSFFPALLLMAMALPGLRRGHDDSQLRGVAAALLWTAISLAALWRLDTVGLAGELPWLKGIKQLLLLSFFVAMACLPAWQLGRSSDARRELCGWERALSLGLAVVVVYGLLQAMHFYLPMPFMDRLDAWCASNPAIASGSGELYLGHRFVGIPRVRAAAPEPLLLGSYLLAAVPITLLRAWGESRWARWWRLGVGGLGMICLLLTFSRGVYFGLAILVLLLVWGAWRGRLPRPRPWRLAWTLGVGVVAVSLGTTLVTDLAPWRLPVVVAERLLQSFAGHDMSNLTRVYAWEVGARAFVGHPLLGIGWGGFGFWYYRLAPTGGAAAHFGWPVANNLPLLVLAETGLVGAVLWIRALWPALSALRGPRTRRPEPTHAIGFVLASLCMASAAQALTYSQWNLPHLWLLAGVSAAWTRRAGHLV